MDKTILEYNCGCMRKNKIIWNDNCEIHKKKYLDNDKNEYLIEMDCGCFYEYRTHTINNTRYKYCDLHFLLKQIHESEIEHKKIQNIISSLESKL